LAKENITEVVIILPATEVIIREEVVHHTEAGIIETAQAITGMVFILLVAEGEINLKKNCSTNENNTVHS